MGRYQTEVKQAPGSKLHIKLVRYPVLKPLQAHLSFFCVVSGGEGRVEAKI